jgi:hypothetical protein
VVQLAGEGAVPQQLPRAVIVMALGFVAKVAPTVARSIPTEAADGEEIVGTDCVVIVESEV